jgi:hypothetical protein
MAFVENVRLVIVPHPRFRPTRSKREKPFRLTGLIETLYDLTNRWSFPIALTAALSPITGLWATHFFIFKDVGVA